MNTTRQWILSLSLALVSFLATVRPLDAATNRFHLSVLVDFIDDALETHYTPAKLDKMMALFREMGIRRVYWVHLGGAREGMFWSGQGSNEKSRSTSASLGGTPIKAAVRSARKAGLEIYGYLKPYEGGMSYSLPAGSPQAIEKPGPSRKGGPVAVASNFVRQHPDLRIRRRMTDIPAGLDSIPIQRIDLVKSDDRPTRVRKEHIEIWTSPDNYRYERRPTDFDFRDTVEQGRVLTLRGLNLTNKYVLVTTNLRGKDGDFANHATRLIRAFGPNHIQLPISVATDYCVWKPKRNFRTYGLEFDTGGYRAKKIVLDVDSSNGDRGFIAFCRGRNEYSPGALCEAYSEVRQHWLRLLRECLDAGVDGIDFRVQCHSTWSDEPFAYGYNEPIIREYRNRHGANIPIVQFETNLLAEIRGEYFTQFLKQAARMIHQRDKRMQVHVNIDLASPEFSNRINPFTYPRNIKFDWQTWLGFADEVTFRSLVLRPAELNSHAMSQKVISASGQAGLPIHFNRYLNQAGQDFEALRKEIQIIRNSGRFRSFILYEGKRLIGPDGAGSVRLRGKYGTMEQWKKLTRQMAN
tara:strand:- start:7094 stop:8830 length:1737 start_codon:yes stop_codon:yes gene_type:complete